MVNIEQELVNLIKVFLCVSDFDVIKNMMVYENDNSKIKIVGISTTVMEHLKGLEELDVDVFVLQYTLDKKKSNDLLEYVLLNKREWRVLPLFQELDSEVIHLLLQYGLQNFLVKPFSFPQLLAAIENEQLQQQTLAAATTVESMASEIMLSLGLPAHLDGFGYIQTSAVYVAKNMDVMHLHMKNVYQQTAKAHHSTAARVEKCIRTAIAFAYRNQPEKICINNCKPTNTQIISYISEKLKLFGNS